MQYIWMMVLGAAFIFLMTSLGAGVVYFFKKSVSNRSSALLLGFASGVMLAASIWSLLLPALALSEARWGGWAFVPVTAAFLFGCFLLTALLALSRRLLYKRTDGALGKSLRVFLAVTLHNIPEGLAVGFAFGAAVQGGKEMLLAAFTLALGIGIQNFPEGAAIALPAYAQTKSKQKAFLQGVYSGAVEPIFAAVGYFLSAWLQPLQAGLLALSAGAMLFVVADDLLPDSKVEHSSKIGAWGTVLGFAFMMMLDVALG